jgi:(2R)-ethylmalonyl-CoA mutase
MLAVTLSKNARARAIQLPAWNEALGLPRPWDQQWALRMQQVLAMETDLLEYGDILDGSPIIDAKVRELIQGAEEEMQRVQEEGGMVQAVETGYVKRQLVTSHTARMRNIEAGSLKIIGVNCFTETAESPLTSGTDSGIMKVDATAEREQIERLRAFRAARNTAEAESAISQLKEAARSGVNIMDASIRCAHAGVTRASGAMNSEASSGNTAPRRVSISPPRAWAGPTPWKLCGSAPGKPERNWADP